MSSTPVREPSLGPIATILTLLAVLLIYAVPPSLLDFLGFNYGTPNGSPLEKVHPGTDLIMAAVVVEAMRRGNPLRYAGELVRRFPGSAIMLATSVVLTVYLIRVQRAPFTPTIDTFVMPALLFPLLVDLGAPSKRLLELGLHVFMAVNAVVGIVEFLSGWRLIPLNLNGLDFTAEIEWRASGLLGHPLASSAGAGIYALTLALGCGRGLPGGLRLPMIALQYAALGAFGGRTALVITSICLAALVVFHVAAVLAGRSFDRRWLAGALLGAPLLGGAVAWLVATGYFDQLMSRFADDNGSAKAREVMLHIFSYFSFHDILIGPDQNRLATALHLEGIEVGIESFWIGMIMLCGLGMALVVFAALGTFIVTVMQRADWRAIVPLIFFTLVISTSVSLSAKSTSLGQFIAMVLVLMPARPQRQLHEARRPYQSLAPA